MTHKRQVRKGIEKKILLSILWIGVVPCVILSFASVVISREQQWRSAGSELEMAARRTSAGLRAALAAHGAWVSGLATSGAFAMDLPSPLQINGLSYTLLDSTGQPPPGVKLPFEVIPPALSGFNDESTAMARFVSGGDVVWAVYRAPIQPPKDAAPSGWVLAWLDMGNVAASCIHGGMGWSPQFGQRDTYQVVLDCGPEGWMSLSSIAGTASERAETGLDDRLTALFQPERHAFAGSQRMRRYALPRGETSVLLAYCSLGVPSRAYILVSRPEWSIYWPVDLWAAGAVTLCLALVLLLTLLVYRNVHNNIVRNILLVNEGAQIIGQGDLDLKLKINTGDEIEELATSFNLMAQALRKNIRELERSLENVTKAREELHAANEELKTLDEMKTNLLSNVSHELRTPLVSVMGYSDMIYNGKAGPVTDCQREYLAISLRNIDRLVTLIENLLDFSRLHRGAETMAFDTFDLSECARVSLDIIRPLADARGIVLRLDAPDGPVLVEGDKGKIGQVFNNLLSNAVKFSSKEGRVTITIVPGAGDVSATVADTGIGIPQEALDKVFTRFYQYDASSTRKYGGTGIGLSISQDIMRLHGSRITVTSNENVGSEFSFALPVKTPRGDLGASPGVLPVTETSLIVALLTLERTLPAQFRLMLEQEGIEVAVAGAAVAMTALVEAYHPDCILLDAESAIEPERLLEELTRDEASARTPMVLLSHDDGLFERWRDFAATRIRPGFRKSALLSAIRYATGRMPGPESLAGPKVLCVDDDPEVITFIERCLEAEGYAVERCMSGEQALDMIERGDFGLLLLDIAMPGLDGWETCMTVKRDLRFSGIKVFMVTAKPVDPVGPRMREARADGLLLKPFKAEDLVELVHTVQTLRPRRAS